MQQNVLTRNLIKPSQINKKKYNKIRKINIIKSATKYNKIPFQINQKDKSAKDQAPVDQEEAKRSGQNTIVHSEKFFDPSIHISGTDLFLI